MAGSMDGRMALCHYADGYILDGYPDNVATTIASNEHFSVHTYMRNRVHAARILKPRSFGSGVEDTSLKFI
jgi:hypothetical protein